MNREGVVLETITNEFENDSVLNPAVINHGNTLHMFYRAVRVHNRSSVCYCRLEGSMMVVERKTEPMLVPQFDYECNGIEGHRIVQIEGLYYLTYTAYDGFNAMGALATSEDMVHWQRHGIIKPQLLFDHLRELSAKDDNMTNKYFCFDSSQLAETMQGKKLYVTDKDIVMFPCKINGTPP